MSRETPATDEAKEWEGWGTALKPAAEDWWLMRKPLIGTVAENVLERGTGALNIDGCRIDAPDGKSARYRHSDKRSPAHVFSPDRIMHVEPDGKGRWPANVTLDEEAGRLLDEQSGERPEGSFPESQRSNPGAHGKMGAGWSGAISEARPMGDTGGASRFFYTSKASRAEREEGLRASNGDRANTHCTVKSISLMRWLIRLITPPVGLVLDPFAGSGSTGCAAVSEGFRFIGMEIDHESAEIARKRIQHWGRQLVMPL